ncbi:MAG: nicotinate-nucleotide adenylyltransferase [Opitutales bacterium]
MNPVNRQIGLFGGSFDPVHCGHLILARDFRETCELDEVVFIPAARAPLRKDGPRADGETRLKMLRAAIADTAGFSATDLEIRRGGTSYTIETVTALAEIEPGATFYWLIGADQLSQLDQWKAVDRLCEQLIFAVAARPGTDPEPPASMDGLQTVRLPDRQLDLSSTEIRRALADGRSIDFLVHPAVHRIIQTENLYQRKASTPAYGS